MAVTGEPGGRIAVVTDSTAMLPPAVARAYGITVVPLQVVVDGTPHLEGEPGATPRDVAAVLAGRGRVTTSQPAPAAFAQAYADAVAAGAEAVVSVHLSGLLSGTVDAARSAAAEAPVPVEVVDTRQVAFATGYAAVAAVEAVAAGADAEAAGRAALERAGRCTSVFYVDTLEHLRRGGRIGAAAALLGTALSVRPLLGIVDGEVATLEKVRTASRAVTRLVDLALADPATGPVSVAVGHLAAPERATAVRTVLAERLHDELGEEEIWETELCAVLGAHVGPGTLAVCVARD